MSIGSGHGRWPFRERPALLWRTCRGASAPIGRQQRRAGRNHAEGKKPEQFFIFIPRLHVASRVELWPFHPPLHDVGFPLSKHEGPLSYPGIRLRFTVTLRAPFVLRDKRLQRRLYPRTRSAIQFDDSILCRLPGSALVLFLPTKLILIVGKHRSRRPQFLLCQNRPLRWQQTPACSATL